MAVPLKLGAIEQQHLQELYDAAGIPRDELPYSAEMARVCRDFQDRTFKNANEAQVYGALVKYVRSGRRGEGPRAKAPAAPRDRVEQARQLKEHRPAGQKLEPYTNAFDHARDAFARHLGAELSQHDFWHLVRLAGARTPGNKARPPAVREAVVGA